MRGSHGRPASPGPGDRDRGGAHTSPPSPPAARMSRYVSPWPWDGRRPHGRYGRPRSSPYGLVARHAERGDPMLRRAGERIAPPARGNAVLVGLLPGLGQRDVLRRAEPDIPAPAIDHQALHPGPRPRVLHEQIQGVPVRVAPRRGQSREPLDRQSPLDPALDVPMILPHSESERAKPTRTVPERKSRFTPGKYERVGITRNATE